MWGRVCIRSKDLRGWQGLPRAAIDDTHTPRLRPHRRAGKTLVQQDLRRSHCIAVGDKGRKATGGIFAVDFVKPDFIALHGNPIQRFCHSMPSAGALHCAMLMAGFICAQPPEEHGCTWPALRRAQGVNGPGYAGRHRQVCATCFAASHAGRT